VAHFGAVSFSLTVEITVQHRLLAALIELCQRMPLPEIHLAKHNGASNFSRRQRLGETVDEPKEPARDVKIAFLSKFERPVIFASVAPDLA